MGLIELIITLIIVGVLLWAIETYLPIDPGIKKLIHVVVIIVVILWLLRVFGVFTHLGDIRTPSP